MKFGSLFSGMGGFDLGLERAGMQPAYQVEVDKTCLQVLETRWPNVRRHGDITTTPSADLAGVDLVCGGFPCQDVSVAGRRAGLAGERSGLWFEFHRILADTRPRWCLIENVPGLLTSNEGRDFGTILRGLAELGYGVAWRILDAQYFGVAQRRNRVFVVGSLGDFACVEVLLESEGLPGDPPARREAGEAVARSVTPSTRKSSGQSTGGGGFVVAKPLAGAAQDGGYRTTDVESGAFVVDARGLGKGEVTPSLVGDHMDRVTDYTPIVAAPLRSRSAMDSNLPGRGGENDENLVTYWDGGDVVDTLDASQISKGQMMPERRHFPVAFEARLARNGRGAPEEITPPLKAESGRTGKGDSAPLVAHIVGPIAPNAGPGSHDAGNFHSNQGVDAGHILPEQMRVRRLTPIECERLQGFPDLWTEGHSDSARYRMIGNAVCAPVAEWIGRRILEVT